MTFSRFGRYELLTTDVAAAGTFYSQVFGAHFWGADFTLANLPEPARARGAKPHFRGQLGVTDVEGTLQRFLADGSTQLGPPRHELNATRVGLKDPFGAILTLTSETIPPPRSLVAWHLMATLDHESAFAWYSELFAWKSTGTVDLLEHGQHQLFSWDEAGATVGSISNVARSPHIHTQWLFYFRVDDIERAAARVTELGGLALPTMRGVNGAIMTACDDAQGGAFGLYQP
jgi:predicted enzyme related to lactoylglutathione lyase